MLKDVKGTPYAHVMLIDGNDLRGIDVGLLTRAGYPITAVRSHVEDTDQGNRIFSRDCPEFTVDSPGGTNLMVLVNQFKSKGFGPQSVSNALRLRQATRVAQINRRLRDEGQTNVAVVGEFNETPASAPLAPLFKNTGIRDVSEHPAFVGAGRLGTPRQRDEGRKDRLRRALARSVKRG
jgi:predicted extracellular nuclease